MVFAYIEILKYNKWFSNLFLVLFSVILILFAGLRDGAVVGTDSPAYFDNYQYGFWKSEFGYRFLNYFFYEVLESQYNWFLIFLNFLSVYLIAKFIKLNSYFYLFPLLIYFSDFFLYYNMSGIRQALAISFVCLSVYYVFNSRYKSFFFFLICAALFHITSLVFIFAIFIPKKKIKLVDYLKFTLLGIIGFFIIGYLLENIPYLSKKFLFYLEVQEVQDNIYVVYIIGLLKRSIVILLAIIYGKDFFNNNQFIYFFNLYLVGFIIFVATYLISADFGVRFGSYYTVLDTVLVGNMLYLAKKLHQRIIIAVVYSIVIIYKLYTYSILDAYEYKLFF